MPAKKKVASATKKPEPIKKTVATRLTATEIAALEGIAKQQKSTLSDVLRDAAQQFISNAEITEADKRQTKLERRIMLENDRLRSLLVKSIRCSGQILYFVTQPILAGGLPKKPLHPRRFQQHWEVSQKE